METTKPTSENPFSDPIIQDEVAEDPFAQKEFKDEIDAFFYNNEPKKDPLVNQRIDLESSDTKKGGDAETENLVEKDDNEEGKSASRYLQYLSISFLKDWFNVDTNDVLDRLKYAAWPFKKTTLFNNNRYDLYGPLWIVFTVVVTTSIFGAAYNNMTHEDMTSKDATNTSIHHISRSFFMLMFYVFVNPLILFYQFAKEGDRN